ncbi:hypothetical protein EON68_01815 [archaeon]|nr:MAG: hypothetical protein EON68_01815 [archaeon]
MSRPASALGEGASPRNPPDYADMVLRLREENSALRGRAHELTEMNRRCVPPPPACSLLARCMLGDGLAGGAAVRIPTACVRACVAAVACLQPDHEAAHDRGRRAALQGWRRYVAAVPAHLVLICALHSSPCTHARARARVGVCVCVRAVKAELAAAKQEIAELHETVDGLSRKNKVLADKLRIAEETLRVKSKLHGTALPPGRVPRPGSARVTPGMPSTPSRSARSSSPFSMPGDRSVRPHSSGAARSRSPSIEGRRGEDAARGDGDSVRGSPRATGVHRAAEKAGAATSGDIPRHAQQQIDALQAHVAKLSAHAESLQSQLHAALTARTQTPSATAAAAAPGTVTLQQGDLMELERQIRDKAAQVLLLKSRYDHIEARSAAERDLYDRAIKALEEQNSELLRTRSALQVCVCVCVCV